MVVPLNELLFGLGCNIGVFHHFQQFFSYIVTCWGLTAESPDRYNEQTSETPSFG
jgi:hypothetical protein